MWRTLFVGLAALVLTVTVSLAGAGEKLTVGFSNRTLDGPFFQALSAAVKEQGEAAGYTMLLTDARTDFTKQIADVEDMLVQNLDYLILNPQDPKAALQIVKRAEAAKVPVIIIDMNMGPAANVLTRITGNNVEGNLLIGEYAAKMAGNEKMKLSLVSFQQGVIVTTERRTSFITGIVEQQLRDKGHTDFEIVMQTWAGGTDEGGLKCVEDIITAHPETNALYTETSLHLKGMVNALRAAKRTDIKVYSFDGAKFEYDMIKAGTVVATGENSPAKLVEMAFDVIKRHHDGERVFPFHMAPKGIMVNKSNVDAVYNDGF